MPITEAQRKRWAKRADYIRSRKNIPCMDCGQTFPDYCMDFHHLDEETKSEAIGRSSFISKMSMRSKKVIDEEIEKCVIVCACCHRKRHHALDKS